MNAMMKLKVMTRGITCISEFAVTCRFCKRDGCAAGNLQGEKSVFLEDGVYARTGAYPECFQD